MSDEEKEEIMKQMSAEQADAAMNMAEDELGGEDNEKSDQASN
jgi:predicted Fe-S protein YdhL (DUF1289 family)